jgi:hypothetical protein
LGGAVDGGFMRLYDGTQPTDPDTALSGNTLIVECALGNPAMAIVVAGIGQLNTIGAGVVVAAGSPTFARFLSASEESFVDMAVGTEILLTKAAWVVDEPFPAPTVSWSFPLEC